LPFHIPASSLFVDGEEVAEGEITITGASASGLRLEDGRLLTDGDGLCRAPAVALARDRTLVVSPAAMIPPWSPMPFAYSTLGFQVEYQARHLALVEETLALCRRFVSDHFAIVSDVMRVLAL